MVDLIQKMFGKGAVASKDVAKERLRQILVHDRANVSPQFLEGLKEDMAKTVSNYMEINEEEMEVRLDSTHSSVSLVASIPVHRMKRGAVSGE